MESQAGFISSDGMRRRMSAQRSRDTEPELALRRALHRAGLRYRIHERPVASLRRTADIVFRRARVAVFVDGCFWHGCPDHGVRRHKVNSWYWPDKIARNKARDADTDNRLAESGWRVIRVWEHEASLEAAEQVIELVRKTGV